MILLNYNKKTIYKKKKKKYIIDQNTKINLFFFHYNLILARN